MESFEVTKNPQSEKKRKLNFLEPGSPLSKLVDLLNRLAWLSEYQSPTCTGIMLIEGKLIVADNEYKKTYPFIESVVDYFALFTHAFKDGKVEAIIEQRKAIFKKIFNKKFPTHGNRLANNASLYKDEIINHLMEVFEVAFDPHKSTDDLNLQRGLSSVSLTNKTKERSTATAVAFDLGWTIIRRIQGIENYIASDENDEIKQALLGAHEESSKSGKGRILSFSNYGDPLKSDIDWINDKTKKGYRIAGIDYAYQPGQDKNKLIVHAELKLLEIFFASTYYLNNVQPKDEKIIPIGISKRCCYHCGDVISSVNEVLAEYGYNIIISGLHNIKFPNWNNTLPLFLLEKKIPAENEEDYANLGEEYSLESSAIYKKYPLNENALQRIRETFAVKQEEFLIKVYQEKESKE